MTFKQLSQAERLASVETTVIDLAEEVKGLRNDIKGLIELRNKGAGVLWFLTAVGSILAIIAGFGGTILSMIRGY